jgi:acetylornithine/succinyldiaminopimelate/putrescine aminotransferase
MKAPRSDDVFLGLSRQSIVEMTREHLNAGKTEWLLDLEIDLVVGRRDGCFLYDMDRGPYLDVDCDGTTFNLGHQHPRLVSRLKRSAQLWDIGSQFLPSAARVVLARELLGTVAPSLAFVHFASTGSEANEAAIKAARAATGREKVVSVRGAQHGAMGLAGHLTGGELLIPSTSTVQASGGLQVPWNDLEAIEAAVLRKDVAAVIIEPIAAAVGWPMPSSDYHARVREVCSATGTLLIADEAHTGLGRTGKIWAIDHWNVVPDILVMAKGAGGGVYPLAYCLMTSQAAAWMTSHPLALLSTFAGSELGCIIGCEVLRITKDPHFLMTVNGIAEHLSAGLKSLAARFPTRIVEVRQLGLAAALKFADPHGGALMMSALFKHHVWAMAAAFDLSVIQIKPPLIIERTELELLLDALHKSIIDCWGDSRVNA